MSEIAIQVENLGKMYRIGGKQERYKRFTETMMDTLAAPLRRLRNLGQPTPEDQILWALRNISFEVKQGDVVGIIGRNGAGKSTLLKVLSRITEPTEGEARVYGRVGSLLEVGTGFHPELTGRENIYLNGAILGMRRTEIDRKFDEIVAFAEVEKFLDTPVKRYSSGMYVRLAFAVAAHLEPEILVVDEVLAVGDAQFQKKCLGKMGEVAQGGRTVLFVSHNMSAIKTLCKRAILLNEGQVQTDGDVGNVVYTYLQENDLAKMDNSNLETLPRRTGTGEALLRQVSLKDHHGVPTTQLFFGQRFQIVVIYNVKTPIEDAAIEIGISTFDGLRVATVTSLDKERPVLKLKPGLWEITIEVEVTLTPGQYVVDVAIHHWLESKVTIDFVDRTLTFTALDTSEIDNDHYAYFTTSPTPSVVRGFVRPESKWKTPVQISL